MTSAATKTLHDSAPNLHFDYYKPRCHPVFKMNLKVNQPSTISTTRPPPGFPTIYFFILFLFIFMLCFNLSFKPYSKSTP